MESVIFFLKTAHAITLQAGNVISGLHCTLFSVPLDLLAQAIGAAAAVVEVEAVDRLVLQPQLLATLHQVCQLLLQVLQVDQAALLLLPHHGQAPSLHPPKVTVFLSVTKFSQLANCILSCMKVNLFMCSLSLLVSGNTSEQTAQNPIQLNDLRNFLSTLSSYPEGDQRQSGKVP